MHVFLGYLNSVKNTFENELAPSLHATTHLMLVSIGVSQTANKAFVKQFRNLFVGLNENGQVVKLASDQIHSIWRNGRLVV